MQHIVIFPSWGCQLKCSYCSIRHSRIDRTVEPVVWQRWFWALRQGVPRGSIIDIAGGEPLMYDGLVDLLHALAGHGCYWALTTNAKATEVVQRIARERPRGGICINVSDHKGNPEAHANIDLLRRAGYRVNVHRVNHPDAGTHEPDAQMITYQDWRGGRAVDGIVRECTAGQRHWVAGPNGDLWRCVVALETGQPPAGNLFSGEITPGGRMCDFGCSTCYTEDPASWLIEMREVACLTTT